MSDAELLLTADEQQALQDKVLEAFNNLPQGGLGNHLLGEEVEVLYTVAYEQLQKRKLDIAEQIFSYLVLYESQDFRFWIGMGIVKQMNEEWRKAIDAYSMAAILDADNLYPYMHSIECFLQLKDYLLASKAVDAFFYIYNKFYASNPNNTFKDLYIKVDTLNQVIKKHQ